MATSLNEILEKLDFVELVGHHTHLTPTNSSGGFKGLSPFGNERTPSFFVNASSKTWYCFSSGQGGGVLDFVERVEQCGRKEAVEFVKRYVGIVDVSFSSPEDTIRHTAYDYFRQFREDAIKYIGERGSPSYIVDRYELGYLPHSAAVDMLKRFSKDFSNQQLEASGLFSLNSLGKLQCRFANRLVIPIHDIYGNLVSFTGRSTSTAINPKYINAAGLKKKVIVWNLHRAKKSIKKTNMVITTEGVFDAMSVDSETTPTVALLGAKPSTYQLSVLSKVASSIYALLDSDAAGEEGMLSMFEKMEEIGAHDTLLYFVGLDSGTDPDDYVKKHGADGLRRLILSAKPDTSLLLDFIIRKHAKEDKTKAAIVKSVMFELKTHVKSTLTYRSQDLIERASRALGLNHHEAVKWFSDEPSSVKQTKRGTLNDGLKSTLFEAPVYERRVFYHFLNDPKTTLDLLKNYKISTLDFTNHLIHKIVSIAYDTYHDAGVIDSGFVFSGLQDLLGKEEYNEVLSFHSLGVGSFDIHTALEVMHASIISRADMTRKENFLGRKPTPGDFTKPMVQDILDTPVYLYIPPPYETEPF